MGAPAGMAQAAMDVFLERLHGREITYTHHADQTEAAVTHLQVAEAAARTTAAELLADASGASSIRPTVPVQRISRDMRALSIHAALTYTTNLEVYGRVLVGVDPLTPFL